MKSLGIIAEYNPFHKGHQYHIQEAKRISGADTVVVIMSGSFTQRGEMAVADKWQRANWALLGGADLVIELPTIYATSNAGTFAKGGTAILEAIGVDYISFGAESDSNQLINIAALIKKNKMLLDEEIKSSVKEGLSYPKAREMALLKLDPNLDVSALINPNNILAIEYLLNMKDATPVIVQRQGTGYNEKEVSGLPSATAIREMASKGQNYASHVPNCVDNLIVPNMKKVFEMAQFRAISMESNEIDEISAADNGFGNLIKNVYRNVNNYEELIDALKSKRYTSTRISRFICQLILGLTKELAELDSKYVRVLGFNQRGSSFLNQLKKQEADINIITNVNKTFDLSDEVKISLMMDIKANDIFNLINERPMYQNSDYVKKPVIIQN